MQSLANQPLRRKLLLMMMATTTAALLLAATAVSTYEWFRLEDGGRRDVQAQAEILAANLSAAIAFEDVEHAQHTLQGLRNLPQFELACVFDEHRRFLAGQTNAPGPQTIEWPADTPAGVQKIGSRVAIFQPVVLDGQTVGTLYLRSRVLPVKARFLHYLSLMALVVAGCGAITLWLAARLQRVVSQPILDLSGIARNVIERKDYSLRARKTSEDEVGRLVDDFNNMLQQIQARDTALQQAHDDLERRVVERTSELEQQIAERRRFEAALAAETERLLVTLRSIGEAVIATDSGGRIVLFNPVAEQLTGWTAAEAQGRPIEEVLPLLDEKTRQPAPSPMLRVAGEAPPPESSENWLLISREGTPRLISCVGAPIRDPAAQTIGLVLAFRDITEEERTTQELLKASKLESIGLLAGGIAHDFNNILTAILGNLSMASLLAPPTGELAEALGQAEKASARAAGLTRQLLTFAKGGTPVKKSASLPEIIKETAAFVLHGANVKVQFSLAPNLWHAEIDVGQIGQVIHNLVLNALQAMPEGGSLRIAAANQIVEAGAATKVAPGRYVQISIQDTGSGISPENLLRIFDPYFTTKKQGSGLGLATCYSIIRKHDGEIQVDSALGRGTTFRILLPAASAASEKAEAAPPQPLAGQGRILVMDDEPLIRAVATRLLASLGYEASTASDGAEALQLFQEARDAGQPFTAVILDLTVPGGMGGRETIQRLLELDPKIKAIVSSGYSDDPVVANFAAYGFVASVPKPYSQQDLGRVLRTVLERG